MASSSYNSPDFLKNLDQAIEEALDKRQKSLLGALYRIQGSIQGWCNDPACSGCPLATHRCTNGMDERLDKILADHHGEAVPAAEPPAQGPPSGPSEGPTPSPSS